MRRTSHEQRWLAGLDALQDFVTTYGHANVPQHYISPTGYKLGSWVSMQRVRWPHLATEQQRALQQLPGWVLNAHAAAWQEGYAELQAYVAREGHAKVPKPYVAPNGYKLGVWVMTQRARKNGLLAKRRRQLEALPGWCWRVR